MKRKGQKNGSKSFVRRHHLSNWHKRNADQEERRFERETRREGEEECEEGQREYEEAHAEESS